MDVPAGVPQEEGHTGFLHLPSVMLALTFLARKTQPFLPLVDLEVEFLCTKADSYENWCPDSFGPAIQNCKRISHAAQLLLHLANNTTRTQIHSSARNAATIAKGIVCQGYILYIYIYMVELRSIVFYSEEEREDAGGKVRGA